MPKFRKQPVVIEAVQWRGSNWMAVTEFCPTLRPHLARGDWVVVPTLEGDHVAHMGDWIIRGVAGEFYPCKPGIFAATYEPADKENDALSNNNHAPPPRGTAWGQT